MRCFVVPAPGSYSMAARVLSSHRTPKLAYKAIDAQDDPAAWCVRAGELRAAETWLLSYEQLPDYPIVPRLGRGNYPGESRTKWLRARVTEAEKKRIKDAALARQQDESDFVRDAAFRAADEVLNGK